METGGSGVAGLGDAAGHFTCAEARLASSQHPPPLKVWPTGAFLGKRQERGFLTGPFPSGAGGGTVRGTEDGD